eukprot:c13739_g1_i1.p1 GENE.c13739_g1_i1~~c13739_g1_i1.p1  ORF type:complete len:158 (-),score=35.54 c13739_g1_i1:94-567(-)
MLTRRRRLTKTLDTALSGVLFKDFQNPEHEQRFREFCACFKELNHANERFWRDVYVQFTTQVSQCVKDEHEEILKDTGVDVALDEVDAKEAAKHAPARLVSRAKARAQASQVADLKARLSKIQKANAGLQASVRAKLREVNKIKEGISALTDGIVKR